MGKQFKYVDKILLFSSVLLFIIGLVFVFSASNVTAYMSKGVSPYYYFIRQSEFLAGGIVMSLFMIPISAKGYGKFSYLLLIGAIAALVILLIYIQKKILLYEYFYRFFSLDNLLFLWENLILLKNFYSTMWCFIMLFENAFN